MYKLYQYNQNEFRIVCTKDNNCVFNSNEKHIIDYEEIQRISLSRSKRIIREYVKCNNFKYFVTLTISPNTCDRYDLTECQQKAKKIFKAIKRINHDFIYLFITERHTTDGAFHFHGVCSDLPVYINSNGYYSCTYFDKLGFNSFSLIRSQSKCSNYITKYVTKDCVRNKARLYLFLFSWS